jgi:ELWxxDGT repeat protein
MPTLRTRLLLAALLILSSRSSSADTAVRLTDLQAGPDDGLRGLDAAVLGNTLYFVADAGAGDALYRYDGVNAPALVAGTVPLRPVELIAWGNKLYFQGGDSSDRELWSYDPSSGTLVEALDVRVGGNGVPQRFATIPGKLCFGAFTDTLGFELHCWDGSNPVQVFDLAAGGASSFPEYLVRWGTALAFIARPAGEDLLMVYDGSGDPEPVEADPGEPFQSPCCFAAEAGELYFQAGESGGTYRVWSYDGTLPPTRVSTSFEPHGFLSFYRGQLVTDGADPVAGVEEPELWRLVAGDFERVRPGAIVSGTEGHLTAAGGHYFRAYPEIGSDDPDLYRYCGAGPVVVATGAFSGEEAGVTSGRPIAFQGRVFVSATTPAFGEELWAISPAHLFCDDFETGSTSSWP